MSYERTVELQRWPGIGFGFSVIGGSDTHIPPMICALVRDSPALKSNEIHVGDVLCQVNGITVATLETKQVVDIIRNCKKNIVLTLKEDRLAKLKARPFLAEGTLIDVPKVLSEDGSSQDRRYHHTPPIDQHQQQRVLPIKLNHIDAHNVLQSRTRTVGSPKSYEHGTDGKYFYQQARSPAGSLDHYTPPNTLQTFQSSRQSSPGGHSSGSSSRLSEAAMSSKSLSPKSIKSDRSSQQVTTATAHLYNLEDLPRSPRYYTQQPTEATYNSLGNKDKYLSKDYCSNQNYLQEHGYVAVSPIREPPTPTNPNVIKPFSSASSSPSMRTTSISNIHRHTQGRKYNSYDRLSVENNDGVNIQRIERPQKSASYHKKEGQFEFPDGCIQSTHENKSEYNKVTCRPYSNPELDVELLNNGYNLRNDSISQPSTQNLSSPLPRQMRQNHKQSNYSSPNIYDDSQRQMSNEQKHLTLTPSTLSSRSLSKLPSTSNQNNEYNDRIHSPLHVTLNNSSMASSSTVSPMSFLAESEISSSVSSQNKEEVSPADIASRLFTLNGYKDSDVAPLLGKNSDFSQQICREYLRFFNFEGIALDEAVRVFLATFPLTGETQERERILIHFSKRYRECNQADDMDEDGVHTLVCSLMLLNTDLHGQSISNKMTPNDFVNNLSGLNNGKDFQKEYLKTLYNAIKNKEIKLAKNDPPPHSPKPRRKNSAPGNPFIQLKVDSNDAIVYEGLIYRKSVMDPGGRRTSAMRRNWRPIYCVLKGLVLLGYKPDNLHSHETHSIGAHHALAGYAKDYKKRMHVFKLITADWSVYYIQVKDQDEVKIWMDSINVSAALLSSPPLPAPVGSSVKFQRPVLPVSKTRLAPAEQLSHHMDKVKQVEEEYKLHMEYTPDASNKFYTDWENKRDYLEYEIKRFKAYVSVLTTPKLAPIRQKILATMPAVSKTNTMPSPSRQKSRLATNVKIPRSSSMQSLTASNHTPTTERHRMEENRENYSIASGES